MKVKRRLFIKSSKVETTKKQPILHIIYIKKYNKLHSIAPPVNRQITHACDVNHVK